MNDANNQRKVLGQNYVTFLADLHRHLKPKNYLEVGVQFGTTLALAECPTIAVDPNFVCNINVIGKKPVCFFYQQTSDDFFSSIDPRKVLGDSVDFAFLDGMHWFDFLLRDFINTERLCSDSSVIALHDCLPPGYYMTSRDIKDATHPLSAFQGWWAGDVWKIVPTLLKYRPDLSVTIADCAPTGLVVISNLDPSSNVLSLAYDEIIRNFKEMDRQEYDDYWSSVSITSAKDALSSISFRAG